MSRRHRRNAKARHHGEDMPVLVESRMQAQEQQDSRLSYEEAKWAFLSPRFRDAHNRLRQQRGLPTIPPPVIDRYVPRRAPAPVAWDPNNVEWRAAVQEYHRGKYNEGVMMGGIGEGFEVKQGDGDGRRVERK